MTAYCEPSVYIVIVFFALFRVFIFCVFKAVRFQYNSTIGPDYIVFRGRINDVIIKVIRLKIDFDVFALV